MVITNKTTGEFISLKNFPKDLGDTLYNPPLTLGGSRKTSTFSIGFHTKEERDLFDCFLKEFSQGALHVDMRNEKEKQEVIEHLNFCGINYILYNIYKD